MNRQAKSSRSKAGQELRYAVVGLGHIAQVAMDQEIRKPTYGKPRTVRAKSPSGEAA